MSTLKPEQLTPEQRAALAAKLQGYADEMRYMLGPPRSAARPSDPEGEAIMTPADRKAHFAALNQLADLEKDIASLKGVEGDSEAGKWRREAVTLRRRCSQLEQLVARLGGDLSTVPVTARPEEVPEPAVEVVDLKLAVVAVEAVAPVRKGTGKAPAKTAPAKGKGSAAERGDYVPRQNGIG